MKNRADWWVDSEIAPLKKLLVHCPDAGIGKIIPGTFADNLYDDIVHLENMQREYGEYVRLLQWFLDPSGKGGAVLEAQDLLAQILDDEKVRLRLISAVCSYEESSFATQQRIEAIADAALLAKVLITGILPASVTGSHEDEYIFPPIPNFIFTRDIGVMIKDHLLLSRMATGARKRESLLAKFLALYCLFPDSPERVLEITEDSDFFLYEEEERKQRLITIEGGDIMMIHPRHLIVGCSERTSSNAVNEIIHTIFSRNLGIEKISVVVIPKRRAQMHIDTIFTQVRRDCWVLYGRYSERILDQENAVRKSYLGSMTPPSQLHHMEKSRVLRFYKPDSEEYSPAKDYSAGELHGIEALLRDVSESDFGVAASAVRVIYSGGNDFPYDDREQWTDSCNLVALKEGVVVGYDRNERTAQSFREAGFTVYHTANLLRQFDEGLDPQSLENALILVPSAELSRARGGPHCMSMPLLRDSVRL